MAKTIIFQKHSLKKGLPPILTREEIISRVDELSEVEYESYLKSDERLPDFGEHIF